MNLLDKMKAVYSAATLGKWFIGKSHTEDVAIREDEYNGAHPEFLDDAQCIITVLPGSHETPCQMAQAKAEFVVLAHGMMPHLVNAVGLLQEAHETMLEEYSTSGDWATEAGKVLNALKAEALDSGDVNAAVVLQPLTDDEISFDDAIARAEGWGLFETEGRLQLQRNDEPESGQDAPKFASDADAIVHVVMQAQAGSTYHSKALSLLGALVG